MDDPGDKFLSELEPEALDALIEAMVLVATADGEFSAEERVRFAHCVAELTAGRMPRATVDGLVDEVGQTFGEIGLEGYAASVAKRITDPRTRRIALVLAADVAGADGPLPASEREALRVLGRALEVPDEEAEALLADASRAPDADG